MAFERNKKKIERITYSLVLFALKCDVCVGGGKKDIFFPETSFCGRVTSGKKKILQHGRFNCNACPTHQMNSDEFPRSNVCTVNVSRGKRLHVCVRCEGKWTVANDNRELAAIEVRLVSLSYISTILQMKYLPSTFFPD